MKKINMETIAKLFTISSHGEIIYEANGVEMEKNVKVILSDSNPYFYQIVFYDRNSGVFYDIETDECYSEKEIASSDDYKVGNFYLINFNNRDQESIVSAYEKFKYNHKYLFEDVYNNGVDADTMKEEVANNLCIYEIAKKDTVKNIKELMDAVYEIVSSDYDGALGQALRNSTARDITSEVREYTNLINKLAKYQRDYYTIQVTGYSDEIDGYIYLTDQHQINEVNTNRVSISTDTNDEWVISPFNEVRSIDPNIVTNENDISYLYYGLENFRLNNSKLLETEKVKKQVK